MITRQVIAVPVAEEAMRIEFERFLNRAAAEGWGELRVRFGIWWRADAEKEYDDEEEIISPEALSEKVFGAESRNEGRIGEDDLYITPSALGVEHLFCHEGDIHLEGPESSVYLESEAKRLASLGWTVYESRKTSEETAYLKVSRFKPEEDSR